MASVGSATSPLPAGFDPTADPSKESGAVARISGRMLNELSHAQITGVENLLTKPIRALASGDVQRADQLVQRVARMPYDEREEGSPGVQAASMLVYRTITDRLEASGIGDSTWLDVVLEVHPGLDVTGRATVASIVHGFVLQEPFFTVSPAEKRRIRRYFGDAPLEADLGDEPDSTVEQRHALLRLLLLAVKALGDAFTAVVGEPMR